MKVTSLIVFIFCCASNTRVLGQTLVEKKLRDKEGKEIAYIIDRIKVNRKVDSLIEWKLYGRNGDEFSYRYKRDKLAFFKQHKDTGGIFLQSINYYHRSLKRVIFYNDKLDLYEITDQARFRVWMSNDRLSIYFCVINSDKVMIWLLSNGNTVYTSTSAMK